MALTETDRNLLQRCLAREPRSWENFVDRYLGLVTHVVNHTARAKSMAITLEDREDLCAEVFLAILKNDFAVLRSFRGASSLPTYLTVIARRVVVRGLLKNQARRTAVQPLRDGADPTSPTPGPAVREQVEQLLHSLDDREAAVVRMYHLEGRSYREISSAMGLPENSIGPTLSRAREKLRGIVELSS